jgi:hypothetical protein
MEPKTTKLGPAEPWPPEAVQSLIGPETNAGPGRSRKRPPAAFLRRERTSVPEDAPVYDASTRRFLYAAAERGLSQAEVLETIIARARRAPGRTSLQRLRTVVNDVGSRRGGSGVIRRLITQELISELFERQG